MFALCRIADAAVLNPVHHKFPGYFRALTTGLEYASYGSRDVTNL